ncbi:unnamed protein product [Ilex paraguariensis]|uniref:Membrane-associated kinase regulator 4 n=1 Tax=Ilex paraguariensis TaxID=185542 RepID=A0ABC8SE06_9AQUA
MAASLHSSDPAEEGYIDIEVSSHANLFCHFQSSPPHPLEFEFQMFSSSSERDTTTSPADELFYKGKLLPLHLPPRLQMVEKLLQHSNSYDYKPDTPNEFFSTPLTTNTNTTPTTLTSFDSCNISPSESCQVSRELNPDEYFFEYSTVSSGSIGKNPKGSWTRKLNLVKHSSIGSKLTASGIYLKSLFRKSGCSAESCTISSRRNEEGSIPKVKEYVNKYVKVAKKTPFGQIQRAGHPMSMRNFNKEKIAEDDLHNYKSSFSDAIKRLSTTKSSSSSSSPVSSSSSSTSNSNGSQELHFNKTCSGISEIENPIQAAIAHCKRAQQQLYSRKTIPPENLQQATTIYLHALLVEYALQNSNSPPSNGTNLSLSEK